MPYIQLKPEDGLTDELHCEIADKAKRAKKTIPKYVLDCIKYPPHIIEGKTYKHAVLPSLNKPKEDTPSKPTCYAGDVETQTVTLKKPTSKYPEHFTEMDKLSVELDKKATSKVANKNFIESKVDELVKATSKVAKAPKGICPCGSAFPHLNGDCKKPKETKSKKSNRCQCLNPNVHNKDCKLFNK
jgi:hypothetical protein